MRASLPNVVSVCAQSSVVNELTKQDLLTDPLWQGVQCREVTQTVKIVSAVIQGVLYIFTQHEARLVGTPCLSVTLAIYFFACLVV